MPKVYPIELWTKMYNEGLSIKQIAKELHQSKRNIAKALDGILRRVNHRTIGDFISQVAFGNDEECWEWVGSYNNHGYGTIKLDGEALAHRWSYKYFNGDTCGLNVCHSCDNPKCVNPNHLFLGTQKDNSLDMARKGRHPYLLQRKLPDEKVRDIRRLASLGYKSREISDKHGMTVDSIQRITSRRYYKDVI